MAAVQQPKPKRQRRPLWLKVARLVDPDTGESVGAFVPAHHSDSDAMRARKFKVGEVVRGEFVRRRNPMHYRKAHALARLVAENVDGFEVQVAAKDWHAVLKKLQLDSGVACEDETIEVTGIGKLLRRVPRSLNFEDMDQSEFEPVYAGLVDHIIRTHWPEMSPEAIEQQAEMLAKDGHR